MSSAREVVAARLMELAAGPSLASYLEDARRVLAALGIPTDMDVAEVRRRMAAQEAAPENKRAVLAVQPLEEVTHNE